MSVASPSPASVPAPPPPSTAGPQVELLLDDEAFRIELHAHSAGSQTVVLTFDPIMWRLDMRPFGVDFLLRSGVDAICVRKKEENFYQPLSRERLAALLAPVLGRYRRRLAYGSSLGAYAVLYYGEQGFDMVISSSPRVSAHPVHGIEHWQRKVRFRHERLDPARPGRSPAVIFYDPKDEQDRRFVDEEIRPAWPQAQFVPIPYAGHPANQFLAEIGYITPCVRALLQGQPLPPLTRRDKARSGMYHQVLAQACLQRRKLRWALTLGERAMQLSPYLNLGRRTLGEIHLARGDLDAAQSHLDWYLERHPQDGPALIARQTVDRLRAEAREAARRQAEDEARRRQEAAELARAEAQRQQREAQADALAQAEALRRANAPWRRVARQARDWLTRSADGQPTLAVRVHDRLQAALPEGTLGVGRDDVVWAYRQFLGRAPENEQVIAGHMRQPNVRALVQAFLDSPEYQRRQQRLAGAGGAPAVVGAARKGAWRKDGPVVLVLGNCQAPGVASVLAASCGVSEAVPLTSLNLSPEAQRAQLLAQAPRAEVWFVNPANTLAREVFAEAARPGAKLVTVPALHFNAFHPDVCYAHHKGTQQLTQQHYNSAVVAWAYGNGLDEARTAELFRADTWQALGYLDQWGKAVQGLRDTFRRSDLGDDFDAFMQRAQRMGCFMHTPNHPHLALVTMLARAAARRAGLEVFDEPAPGELVDGLAGTIWPVYPDIAASLALATGSWTWKFVTRNEVVAGVPAFVRHAFAAYRAQGIAPADLEIRWADTAGLDRVLRERAGLPPRAR